MVKSREELLRVASRNVAQLKREMSRMLKHFMDRNDVELEEIAYVMGISEERMEDILNETATLDVVELSKILVALDLVAEIKPIEMTPLKGYSDDMPEVGGLPDFEDLRPGMPLPPFSRPNPHMFDFDEEPIEDEEDEEAIEEDEKFDEPKTIEKPKQGRDSRGRFLPKEKPIDNEFEKLSDDDLLDIIFKNLWDSEINVETATHEELALFVADKERLMRMRQAEKTAPKAKEKVSVVDDFINMLKKLEAEAEHDQYLAEKISQFMRG
jgi:hypothetical protein